MRQVTAVIVVAFGAMAAHAADIFTILSIGSVDELKQLINNDPGVIRAKDHVGHLPIFEAARRSSPEMAAVLLSAGADATWQDEFGNQPIHQAATFSTTEMLALLVLHGADVNAEARVVDNPPLLCAAGQGNDANVKWLLAHHANIHFRSKLGQTVLHEAAIAQGDHADLISLLINAGAEIDAIDKTGSSPLRDAARWGHRHCAQRLAEAGAKWDIFAAVALGEIAIVKQLIDGQPTVVNATDLGVGTPLHEAARYGETDVAEFLLDHGAKIDAMGGLYGGYPPLFLAVKFDHPDLVELLVTRHARLDLKGGDSTGSNTPLEWARKHGLKECTAILEKAGATAP